MATNTAQHGGLFSVYSFCSILQLTLHFRQRGRRAGVDWSEFGGEWTYGRDEMMASGWSARIGIDALYITEAGRIIVCLYGPVVEFETLRRQRQWRQRWTIARDCRHNVCLSTMYVCYSPQGLR